MASFLPGFKTLCYTQLIEISRFPCMGFTGFYFVGVLLSMLVAWLYDWLCQSVNQLGGPLWYRLKYLIIIQWIALEFGSDIYSMSPSC